MMPMMLRSNRSAPSVRRPSGLLISRNGGNMGGFVGTPFTELADFEVAAGVGVVVAEGAVGVPVR